MIYQKYTAKCSKFPVILIEYTKSNIGNESSNFFESFLHYGTIVLYLSSDLGTLKNCGGGFPKIGSKKGGSSPKTGQKRVGRVPKQVKKGRVISQNFRKILVI